jgi:hypothetical protein
VPIAAHGGCAVLQAHHWERERMDAFEHWVGALARQDPQLLERLRGVWNAAAVEAMRMVMQKGGRELANQLPVLLSPEP